MEHVKQAGALLLFAIVLFAIVVVSATMLVATAASADRERADARWAEYSQHCRAAGGTPLIWQGRAECVKSECGR